MCPRGPLSEDLTLAIRSIPAREHWRREVRTRRPQLRLPLGRLRRIRALAPLNVGLARVRVSANAGLDLGGPERKVRAWSGEV